MGVNRVYEDGSWSHPVAQKVERRTAVPEEEVRWPAHRKYSKKPWLVMHVWSAAARGEDFVKALGFAKPWKYGAYASEKQALVVWRKQVRSYEGMFRRCGRAWSARAEWWIVQPDGSAYTPID